MQNFLSLWSNAGAQITHGGQVQRQRQYVCDNFSSLPTLPWSPIMCSTLEITPADWTADRPIGYYSQSDSPKVHLMSLRQLNHDKYRSWERVFCCERAKRSINRSEISVFKQYAPCLWLRQCSILNGIYTTFSWNLYRRKCWEFSW